MLYQVHLAMNGVNVHYVVSSIPGQERSQCRICKHLLTLKISCIKEYLNIQSSLI